MYVMLPLTMIALDFTLKLTINCSMYFNVYVKDTLVLICSLTHFFAKNISWNLVVKIQFLHE